MLEIFYPPQKSVADLEAQFKEMADQTANLDDEALYGIAQSVSGWSVAQQIRHITDTTGKIFTIFSKMLDGSWQDPGGSLKPIGYVLLIANYIPRGKAKNPFPMDERPDRAALAADIESLQNRLATYKANLDRLTAYQGRGNHPALGTLSPTEYLRFCVVHSRHHQKIREDILAAQAAA